MKDNKKSQAKLVGIFLLLAIFIPILVYLSYASNELSNVRLTSDDPSNSTFGNLSLTWNLTYDYQYNEYQENSDWFYPASPDYPLDDGNWSTYVSPIYPTNCEETCIFYFDFQKPRYTEYLVDGILQIKTEINLTGNQSAYYKGQSEDGFYNFSLVNDFDFEGVQALNECWNVDGGSSFYFLCFNDTSSETGPYCELGCYSPQFAIFQTSTFFEVAMTWVFNTSIVNETKWSVSSDNCEISGTCDNWTTIPNAVDNWGCVPELAYDKNFSTGAPPTYFGIEGYCSGPVLGVSVLTLSQISGYDELHVIINSTIHSSLLGFDVNVGMNELIHHLNASEVVDFVIDASNFQDTGSLIMEVEVTNRTSLGPQLANYTLIDNENTTEGEIWTGSVRNYFYNYPETYQETEDWFGDWGEINESHWNQSHPINYTNDGDWNTYGQPAPAESIIAYFNFTIPEGAIDAIFTLKGTDGISFNLTTYNISLAYDHTRPEFGTLFPLKPCWELSQNAEYVDNHLRFYIQGDLDEIEVGCMFWDSGAEAENNLALTYTTDLYEFAVTWVYEDYSSTNWTSSSLTILSEEAEDSTPPIISNGGSPTSPVRISSAEISVLTNENATCRWDDSPNINYSQMSNIMDSNSLGMYHFDTISGLSTGTYTYYIRCIDSFGNYNTNDFEKEFDVIINVGGGQFLESVIPLFLNETTGLPIVPEEEVQAIPFSILGLGGITGAATSTVEYLQSSEGQKALIIAIFILAITIGIALIIVASESKTKQKRSIY